MAPVGSGTPCAPGAAMVTEAGRIVIIGGKSADSIVDTIATPPTGSAEARLKVVAAIGCSAIARAAGVEGGAAGAVSEIDVPNVSAAEWTAFALINVSATTVGRTDGDELFVNIATGATGALATTDVVWSSESPA